MPDSPESRMEKLFLFSSPRSHFPFSPPKYALEEIKISLIPLIALTAQDLPFVSSSSRVDTTS